jgi:hypothetical protein
MAKTANWQATGRINSWELYKIARGNQGSQTVYVIRVAVLGRNNRTINREIRKVIRGNYLMKWFNN